MAFQKLHENIAFKKLNFQNDCEKRAALVTLYLMQTGFKPFYSWIFDSGLMGKPINKFGITLEGKNAQLYQWRCHFVAGVIINQNQQNDTLIFDCWTQNTLSALKK
jgi:hypothetical protein